MNVYHTGPVYRPPSARRGIAPSVAIMLWIFVGWPASWLLLFTIGAPAILFGIGITIAMIVAVSRPQPVVAAPAPPVLTRYQQVRYEVESLAAVDAIGGCGWCGSRSAHVNDDGRPIPPRHWHAVEIEERIRAKLHP